MTHDLKAFVDNRIKTRGCKSTNEYTLVLALRNDVLAREERFKALIEEGLSSPLDLTAWEHQRSALKAKIASFRRQCTTPGALTFI